MTGGRGRGRRLPHRSVKPEAVTSAQTATLATMVDHLRDARHMAAMADALARRLTTDFTLTTSAPAFVIKTAEGSVEQASETAVLELRAVLLNVAARARARVDRLLAGAADSPGPEKIEITLFVTNEEDDGERDWSASATRRELQERREEDLP